MASEVASEVASGDAAAAGSAGLRSGSGKALSVLFEGEPVLLLRKVGIPDDLDRLALGVLPFGAMADGDCAGDPRGVLLVATWGADTGRDCCGFGSLITSL